MPRLLLGALAALALLPSTAAAASPAALSADAWSRVSATAKVPAGARALVRPTRFAAFTLDRGALNGVLRTAPRERSGRTGTVVSIPTPEGRFERFAVVSAPVMTPGLAARHPEIRTYAGRSLRNRATTIRLSSTPLGLHASVRGPGRAYMVDPRFRGDARRHVAYRTSALPAPGYDFEERFLPGDSEADAVEPSKAAASEAGEPVTLRTHRLALVTDPSYAANSGAADGLDPAAPDFAERLNARVTAAKVVLMTRVNQVYESDFAVRMLLIDATDQLNFNTDAEATGPNRRCGAAACFTAAQLASCGGALLTRNTYVAGLIAGARNYDIGHIGLGKNGGGIAGLGVVGKARKAEGCTGIPKPIGDFFAIDYVAHEMGHQFGGDHTFNGTQGACAATNRNLTGAAAVEPGSGSTIQAYAGICGSDDLQAHSDPVFSQFSIEQMGAYIRSGAQTLSSVQQVALAGFDGTDSYTLGYGAARTAPITRGTNHTAAGIKAALEPILDGGTVTVANVTDGGFQVTFGGSLAGEPTELLSLQPTGATGRVGETIAGGETTQNGTSIATTNTAPTVQAPAPLTIPQRTPFTLTATGGDADGDAVTFLWEQDDPAPPALGAGLVDPVKVTGPLFRVFGTAARYANPEDAYLSPSPGENLPGTDPARSFPDTLQVATDATNALTGTCPPAAGDATPAGSLGVLPPVEDAVVDCYSEFLPTASWRGLGGDGTLHFRVTARDNRPGMGGVAKADTALTVQPAAGPFRVLPALPVDTGLTARWLPAGTDVVLGVAEVKVSLSLDGGRTFPIVLAERTPNDGSQALTVPAGTKTTKGRLKIEAVGNVFFDVSHADLTIG